MAIFTAMLGQIVFVTFTYRQPKHILIKLVIFEKYFIDMARYLTHFWSCNLPGNFIGDSEMKPKNSYGYFMCTQSRSKSTELQFEWNIIVFVE